MRRSFIFGLLSGTLTGLLVLVFISLLDKVPGQEPPKVELETSSVSAVDAGQDTLALTTEPDATRPSGQASEVANAEPETRQTLGPDVTSPSLQPQPSIETSAFATTPVATSDVADVSNGGIDPNVTTGTVATLDDVASDPKPNADTQSSVLASDDTTQQSDVTQAQGAAGIADAPLVPAGEIPRIANAEPFERDASKPVVSFLLIDDPDSNFGVPVLKALKHPITVVVDASHPNAAARIQTLRNADFEVLVSAPTPPGATPADIDAIFEQYFKTAQQAVGFAPKSASGFGSRQVTKQIADLLHEKGYGLVSFEEGLRVAQQIANAIDLPNTTVFRDLDGLDQNSATIRRFIAQGVSKAKRNGSIVFVTRMRAETFAALQIWSQTDKADTVNIAPVSVILNDF